MAAPSAWDRAVRGLLTELAAGLVACRLYSPDHPRALASHARVVERVHEAIDSGEAGEPEVALVVFRQELFVGGMPFTRIGEQVGSLMRNLGRHGIERVGLRRGVTSDEIAILLEGVAGSDDRGLRSTDHVTLGRLVGSGMGHEGSMDEARAPELSVRDRVRLITECFDAVAGGEALPLGNLTEVVRDLDQRIHTTSEPLQMLARLENEPEWPAVHAHNVAALSLILGTALSARESQRLDIGVAGLLHDLGKICRPPTWIAEELSLSGDQWEAIEEHPRLGLELLLESPHIPEIAAVVAFEHHLRWDGGGWPALPTPRPPHPAAALVAVAEVFDLMHTVRGPRGALTREGVAATLADGAGGHFEPFFAQAMTVVWELSGGVTEPVPSATPWDFRD